MATRKPGRPLSRKVTLTDSGRIRFPAHLFQVGDQVCIWSPAPKEIKARFADASDGSEFPYTLFGQKAGHGGCADIQRVLKKMGVHAWQFYGQYEPAFAEDDGSVVIHLEKRKWRA